MLSNYHTHSRYCDGKGEPREYVEFALANGFSALGFSGHAPLPFNNTFSIHNEDYLAYCNEVRALKEEYRGRIDIRLGLEIDYVPGVNDDFRPLIEKGGLDYFIGGVHLVTDPDDTDWLSAGNLRRGTATGLPRRHSQRCHLLLPSNQRHDRKPASHHCRPLQQDSHAQSRPLFPGTRQMVSRPCI